MAQRKTKKADKIKKESLDVLARELSKSTGVVITRASEFDTKRVRRSSGFLGLDVACGGSLIGGRIHQYRGYKSSGKTSTAMQHFKWMQENVNDAKLVWVAFEPFEKNWARSRGVQIAYSDDEIAVIEEQHERRLTPAEKRKLKTQIGDLRILEGDDHAGVLDEVVSLVRRGDIDSIVIDSIGVIQPPEWDAAESFGDTTAMGRHAALIKRFTKSLRKALRGKKTVIIAVNHQRPRQDGKGDYYPGGGEWEFAIDLDVKFKHDGWIFPKDGDAAANTVKTMNAEEAASGQVIFWKIAKTKIGGSIGNYGRYRMFVKPVGTWYPGDADTVQDAIDTAIGLDLIERRGAWYYLGDVKIAKGIESVRAFFRDNPGEIDLLRFRVLDHLRKSSLVLRG